MSSVQDSVLRIRVAECLLSGEKTPLFDVQNANDYFLARRSSCSSQVGHDEHPLTTLWVLIMDSKSTLSLTLRLPFSLSLLKAKGSDTQRAPPSLLDARCFLL